MLCLCYIIPLIQYNLTLHKLIIKGKIKKQCHIKLQKQNKQLIQENKAKIATTIKEWRNYEANARKLEWQASSNKPIAVARRWQANLYQHNIELRNLDTLISDLNQSEATVPMKPDAHIINEMKWYSLIPIWLWVL